MYLNYYELRKEPFSLAPDPDFLYLSQQHKDALGAIIYGIRAKQGFVSVVGEVGTGKTTIVRTYLQKAGRDKILPIFIFNSRISFAELMQTFLREIGIDEGVVDRLQTVNEMVTVAHRAMLEKNRQGNTIVLIIDEAQNMPTDTLAKLCILSNFETTKAKLVQIILVGQPELQKKLALHELRQLRQRIAYRALITPLSEQDSASYLHHRLSLVSKVSKPAFTARAIRKIVAYSKGIPRIINIICENSLVAGYGLQKKPVSLQIVKQVISEHESSHDLSSSRPIPWRKAASGAFLLVLIAILLAFSLPQLDFAKKLSIRLDSLLVASGLNPGVAEGKGGGHVVAGAAKSELASTPEPPSHHPVSEYQEALKLVPRPAVADELINSDEDLHMHPQGLPEGLPVVRQGPQTSQTPHLKIVQRGDTVSSLCQSTYGFVNDRVLQWIKRHNPHIANLDEIRINEIILFPEMKTPRYFMAPWGSSERQPITQEEVVAR